MLSSSAAIELLDSLSRASKQRPRHASSPDASANLQLTETIAKTMLGRSPPDLSLPSLASILPKVVKLYDERTLDLLEKLDGRQLLGRSPPFLSRVDTLASTASSPSQPSRPAPFSFRSKSTVLTLKRPAGKAVSDVGSPSSRARTSASPAPSKRPKTSAFSDPMPRTGSPDLKPPTSSHRSELPYLPSQRLTAPDASVEPDLRARISRLEDTVAAKDKLLADNDKENAQRKIDYLTVRQNLEAALIDLCDDPADQVEQGRLFRQLSISELTERFVTYATESKTIAGLKEELRVCQDAYTFEIDARKAEVEKLSRKLNRLAQERLQDNDAFAAAAQDAKRDLAALRAEKTRVEQALVSKEKERANFAAQLTAVTAKLDTTHRRRHVSSPSNPNGDAWSSSASAAPGLDAQTELRDFRAENGRLKADLARTEKERDELADKLKQPNPIAEHPDRLAVAPLPPAVADSTSAVIDALVKPYEAVFWALEVVEARLADSDFDGGDRAVRKARERLRAMGPLWEEVERRKGLA